MSEQSVQIRTDILFEPLRELRILLENPLLVCDQDIRDYVWRITHELKLTAEEVLYIKNDEQIMQLWKSNFSENFGQEAYSKIFQ